MFLIRIAFWLVVVIMLLPTDRQQQTDVLGTAQAAVKDVSGFCERNPDVCVKGQDAFEVFMQKAEFGANMLMGFIEEKTGTATVEPSQTVKPTPELPASFTLPEKEADRGPQNTLLPTDLEPAWGAAQGT
jgi:hypothetical protein